MAGHVTVGNQDKTPHIHPTSAGPWGTWYQGDAPCVPVNLKSTYAAPDWRTSSEFTAC